MQGVFFVFHHNAAANSSGVIPSLSWKQAYKASIATKTKQIHCAALQIRFAYLGSISSAKHSKALPPSSGYTGSKLYSDWKAAHTAILGIHFENSSSTSPPMGPASAQIISLIADIGNARISAPLLPNVMAEIYPPQSFMAATWHNSWMQAAAAAANTHCRGRMSSISANIIHAPAETETLLRIFNDMRAKRCDGI